MHEPHYIHTPASGNYRKRPVQVHAARWWGNGDHPQDGVGDTAHDALTGATYTRIEGRIVRFFRHPDYPGSATHEPCGRTWHDHGWIDDLEGGHTVCPGDWIITGVHGEHYAVKDTIFRETYEPVDGDE